MAKVFLIQNDGSRTPVTVDELKSYAANGRISRDSKIEFAGKIVEVGKIKELQEFFTKEEKTTFPTAPTGVQKDAAASSRASSVESADIYGITAENQNNNVVFSPVAESSAPVPPPAPSAPSAPAAPPATPYVAPYGQTAPGSQTTARFYNPNLYDVSDKISPDVVWNVARNRLKGFLKFCFIADIVLWVLLGLTLMISFYSACEYGDDANIFTMTRLSNSLNFAFALGLILTACALFRSSVIARTQDAVRQEILLNELLHKRQ